MILGLFSSGAPLVQAGGSIIAAEVLCAASVILSTERGVDGEQSRPREVREGRIDDRFDQPRWHGLRKGGSR